jgi:hypothetical protein
MSNINMSNVNMGNISMKNSMNRLIAASIINEKILSERKKIWLILLIILHVHIKVHAIKVYSK